MHIQSYLKKVEAVLFDGITDVQEIAHWCGGLIVELVTNEGMIRSDMYAIDVPVPGGYTTAGKDFYIFKDGPSFMALDKNTFLKNFKEDDG